MRSAAWVVLSCLLLPTCSFSNGHQLTAAQVNQFSPGRSTISDVQAQLGSPTNTARSSDGTTTLQYRWGTNTASGQNYIPVVGPFIAKSNYTGSVVTYMFAPNGVLTSFRKEDEGQAQSAGT